MLRISTIEADRERRLVVEGKLIEPWTNELRSECQKAKQNLAGRQLVVELNNLTVISTEGENVLAALIADRVKFRCCGLFGKEILRQLTRRVRAESSH